METGKTWLAGAFAQYLRTGRVELRRPVEVKFNPYHDPRDGRFTFAPGNGTLLPRRYSVGSSRSRYAIVRSGDKAPKLQPANFRPNPRARSGGNSRAFNDPLTLDRVFPGLNAVPGGSIIAVADNLLDLTGPGRRLTTDLSLAYTQRLIRQIEAVNPEYRFESLGFPETLEGQARQINSLKMVRATAFYKIKSELRPLQTETLRFLQSRTDAAYADGKRLFELGQLPTRLNPNEAIGNYVDRQVREQLRILYRAQGISMNQGEQVRVNSRASNTQEGRYSVPDSRVGDVAFDVSLTAKTLKTQQVQDFFRSDFRPRVVVIVRPRALGATATYAITNPNGR